MARFDFVSITGVLIRSQSCPFPRIAKQLCKARYFTNLDFDAGYWQTRVVKESKEKTTFITHRCLYEFV